MPDGKFSVIKDGAGQPPEDQPPSATGRRVLNPPTWGERGWPEAAMDYLKAHWHSSQSASEIGRVITARFGNGRVFNKNAVIGKAHRFKLGDKPVYTKDGGRVYLPPPRPVKGQARRDPWPKAAKEYLRELWPSSQSSNEISHAITARFGKSRVFTRDAVSAMAHRCKLGNKAPPPSAAVVVRLQPTPIKPPAAAPFGAPASCQYPTDVPGTRKFRFCEAPVWARADPDGTQEPRRQKSWVYCEEHARLCYLSLRRTA